MSNRNCKSSTLLGLILCLAFCLTIIPNSIAGIVLDPIGQVDWDRNANPGGFQVTFGISPNDQAPTENLISTFSIGLMIVPDSAPNGSLRVQSVSVPTNQLFSQYFNLRVLGGATQVVDGENNESVQFGNGFVPRNVLLSSPKNMFTANIVSPNSDAVGGFKLYAIPEFTTYFVEGGFDGEKFFNAPDGSAPVLLGSFTVTAVPEPASWLLVIAPITGIAIVNRRRNRRLAKTLRIP